MPYERNTRKTRKVIKVGNSLAVTIPKDMIRRSHLEEGDLVKVVPAGDDGTFLVEPMKIEGKT